MFGETFWLKLLGGCLSEWDGQISSYHTQDFLLLAEYGGLDDLTPKTVGFHAEEHLEVGTSLETFGSQLIQKDPNIFNMLILDIYIFLIIFSLAKTST